ncbi:hypothetical protein GCM10010964_07300 [Caldovatus sediminis]|uniref:Murein endopeptidase K n=1 Tax=Caldovatus sediminis TaxID=2041189 RepID=A0A8J2Z963_9PROT|nr:DUF882 domain-containing protein [Caldovatus sediminis]GGG21658.1 hypothetical protein GCM10010964_07300 [Caldovatus sediminis]
MLRRSILLAAVLPAPLLLAAPRPAAGGSVLRRPPPGAGRRLRVRHAATGAAFSGPYHDGRATDPAAMRELSIVLADHHSGRWRPFDPAAIDILWELGQRERMDEFVILSGYRTAATNVAVGGAGDSLHLQARALDVQVPTARLASFGEAAAALGRGGVGLYPSQGFVHIDSGPVRRWGPSGPAGGGRRGTPSTDRVGRIAEAWAQASRSR